MNKEKRLGSYLLPGMITLYSAVFIFYLRANLSEQQQTNKQLSAIAPVLNRAVKDLERHDDQIGNLNIAIAKQCGKIELLLPNAGGC